MKYLAALSGLVALLAVNSPASAQYYGERGYRSGPYGGSPPPYGYGQYGQYGQQRRGGGGACGFMLTTQATTQGPGAGERARAEAMGRWQNEAANRFGPAYTNFGAARAASATCNRQGPYAVYC